ncbi:MAG: NUDIX hydrolase family protein [Promicromonosporaceae bacterium]|nr:NUDIX hydrolase family protein [Promicromonosporaceae bacterium]
MTAAAEMPLPPDRWEPPTADPAGWLDTSEFALARAQLPLVYVDAVPVRTDGSGDVVSVGLLLRMGPRGLTRSIVSGRVLYHERVRDALLRHIEKDLGPVALPQIPASPQPFTIAEYLPTPGITPFCDPRHHAVSLAYVVPVTGDCQPQQDALEIAWLSPEEACGDAVGAEFVGGQGALIKQAMAWVGRFS